MPEILIHSEWGAFVSFVVREGDYSREVSAAKPLIRLANRNHQG